MKLKKSLLCIVMAVLLSVQVFAATPFSDVQNGKWYTEPVTYCQSKGLVSGYKDGTFKPNNNISRAEFCVMLYKLANEMALNKKTVDSDMKYNQYAKQFTDYKPNSWYSDAVASCLMNGYISGTSKTALSLNKNILRQDVAVMIDKMFGWTFAPSIHKGGLCNDETTPDEQPRYWVYSMYRCIDLGIYQGEANWNSQNGSAYKNNYPITRAEMCAVFKYILENQNWINAREHVYEKITVMHEDYFLRKTDRDIYKMWDNENIDINSDDEALYESISKNVTIDSVTIKELNFDSYNPKEKTPEEEFELVSERYKAASELYTNVLLTQKLLDHTDAFIGATKYGETEFYRVPQANNKAVFVAYCKMFYTKEVVDSLMTYHEYLERDGKLYMSQSMGVGGPIVTKVEMSIVKNNNSQYTVKMKEYYDNSTDMATSGECHLIFRDGYWVWDRVIFADDNVVLINK